MRVAVLCGNSARSMYVANTLCANLNVRCIVCEVGHEYSWKKMRRNLRPSTIRAKLYRKIQPHIFPPDVDQSHFFFPDRRPRFADRRLVEQVAHINAPRVVGLLKKHKIEILAVFATSLIRNPELFRLTPGRVLNLHGGLSPWYRGADSIFWALYNGEIERAGCTIHRISNKIDAGELIAHVCPAVGPYDREHRLLYKAIKAAADVYVEAIRRCARGEALGVPQPAGGRLYVLRDRRLEHDRKLQRMCAAGCFDNVSQPERVRWYYSRQPSTGAMTPELEEPSESRCG
jgi:methionyl-tRNA formyltransferase